MVTLVMNTMAAKSLELRIRSTAQKITSDVLSDDFLTILPQKQKLSLSDSLISLPDNCTPIQVVYPDYVDLPGVQIIFGILYAIVGIGGLLGNFMVIYSIVCKRISFTVRKVFIVCLAMSDILIGLTSLPVTSISLFSRQWFFQNFLCKGIGLVQGACIFISSFTLAAIAIDRYFLIVHSTGFQFTMNIITWEVIGIWVLGFGLSSPLLIFLDIETFNFEDSTNRTVVLCGEYCTEMWPNDKLQKGYGFTVLLLQYGLPLCVTSYCYIKIATKIQDQIEHRKEHEVILPEAEKRLHARRRTTNRMTVVMVASFMLTWFPINFLNIARDILDLDQNKFYATLYAAAHVFAMTSTVGNPLIYSWFHEPFKKLVKTLTCRHLWGKGRVVKVDADINLVATNHAG